MKALWSGILQKMRVEAHEPVHYWLVDGAPDAACPAELALNPLVGQHITLRWLGHCRCTACGGTFERVFDNGYCGDCVRTRADADTCMMRPHLCHYGDPENPCRDDTFAIERCFRPHYLYCSLTSDVKVGITRYTNVLSRWMDQGAVEAVTLAELPSRREVGLVEHALTADFKDRTHWMKMLRTETPEAELRVTAEAVERRLHELGVSVLPEERRVRARFSYPVLVWPEKVRNMNLDKTPEISGTLLGIKGQYLYFAEGVINIRRHSGRAVEVLGGPPLLEAP